MHQALERQALQQAARLANQAEQLASLPAPSMHISMHISEPGSAIQLAECVACASEALSNTKEKVEVSRLSNIGYKVGIGTAIGNGIDGWVQVPAEVSPQRSNRSVVSQAQPDCMRKISKAARVLWIGRCKGLAGSLIWLGYTEKARPYLLGLFECITHVVKQHKAHGISNKWKRRSWRS